MHRILAELNMQGLLPAYIPCLEHELGIKLRACCAKENCEVFSFPIFGRHFKAAEGLSGWRLCCDLPRCCMLVQWLPGGLE